MIEKFSDEELEIIKRELGIKDTTSVGDVLSAEKCKFATYLRNNLPDSTLEHRKGEPIICFEGDSRNNGTWDRDVYTRSKLTDKLTQNISYIINVAFKNIKESNRTDRKGIFQTVNYCNRKDIDEMREMYREIVDVYKKHDKKWEGDTVEQQE